MAKKQQDILDRLISSLSVRGFLLHPATLFILASSLMIGGAIYLWESHQQTIVNHDEYKLTAEKIRISPQPAWTDVDLRSLVLHPTAKPSGPEGPQPENDLGSPNAPAVPAAKSPSRQPSILDTQLVPRTAKVMQQVGFVEKVEKIAKSKSGLDIDLVYRRPVAVVELSPVTLVNYWQRAKLDKTTLVPVDRTGMVMPESAGEGQRLLKIMVFYPAQFANLNNWTAWPDVRIQDGAAICDVFASSPNWGLAQIVTKRAPRRASASEIPFELWFDSGTIIQWGNAPGKEVSGEATADVKFQAIEQLVKAYGSFDRIGRQKIDIRSGHPVVLAQPKTAARMEEIFVDLK